MRARAASLRLAMALLLLAGACAGDGEGGATPDLSRGLERVEAEGVRAFHRRASQFYARLARRRFNTLSTYRDEVLRDYFRTESAFADYYADLAQDLEEAHFEQNRPLVLDVLEFRLEGPGAARVVTRFEGENGRPLRWGRTSLVRTDRWERMDGTWWIVPGKL